MAGRLRSKRLALNAEINVVSLIDVILLLLLIFMITAPMMTGGIDLQLPTATVEQVESKDAVLVEIDSVGGVYVDRQSWSLDKLRNTIKPYLKGREEVTIRGDARMNYGTFMKVLSILNAAGVRGYGLMALPEERGG